MEFRAEDLASEPKLWGDLLNAAGTGFGEVQVLCVGHDAALRRVSCFCVFAAYARTKGGLPMFLETVVVLPPCDALGLPEDAIREQVLTQASALVPATSTGHQPIDVLRARIKLTFAQSLTSAGLLAAVRDMSPRTVVLVVAASAYRDPDVPETNGLEAWVPHLAKIAIAAQPLLQPERGVLILDTGRVMPSEKEALALNETNACSLCGLIVDDPYTEAAARLDEIFEQSGLEPTLAAVEGASGLKDWERSLLTARYFARAKRPREAFGACVPRLAEIVRSASSATVVDVADIAIAAGQFPEASELLRRAKPERVFDLEGVEACLRLAHLCGLTELRESLRARIVRLFPDTVSAVRAEVDGLLLKGAFEEIAAVLSKHATIVGQSGSFESISLLASGLSTKSPDYSGLLRTIGAKTPDALSAAQAFSIRHATTTGALDEALKLASEPLMSDAGCAACLDALSVHFLGGHGSTEKLLGPILRPLERVVEFLAANPHQGRVRAAFSHVISPRVSGTVGVIALAAMLRRRFTASLTLASDPAEAEPVTPDELMVFHGRLFSKFQKDSARFAGGDVLPAELLTEDLPRILVAYMHLLSFLSTREAANEDDVADISQALLASLTVAKATQDEAAPADLIVLAGGGLARLGYFQGARDLAEHVLSMVDGASSAPARRHAWRCFADLYLRVNNPLEALIGITCATFTSGEGPALSLARFWNEVNIFVKTLRDLGFVDEAHEELLRVRKLLEEHGEFDGIRSRWGFLHCSMAFESVRRAKDGERTEAARSLATELVVLIDEAVKSEGDLVPLVSLAAQILPRLERLVPDEAHVLQTTLDRALPLLTQGQRYAVEVFKPEDLEMVTRRFAGNRTRYSADLATDLRLLSIAARASLARAADEEDVETGLLATECVAFHGATIPGVNDASSSDSALPFPHRDQSRPALAPTTEMLITSRVDAATIVRSLVEAGIEVHAVGVDSLDRAIRVSFASDGSQAIVTEPAFSLAAFHEWSIEYPRRYSDISPRDPFGDDVSASLARLALSWRTNDSETALILDAELQSLPANLLPADGGYRGGGAPTICVPSLSWLRSMNGRPAQGRRRVAWFGYPSEDDFSALRILREDIEPTLKASGFELFEGALAPIDGAEIIVVGAHGRIFDESSTGISAFRAFSDERSLRFSLDQLCQLIEPPAVMVLFACSAGRLDDMPFSQGLWGAPAALLRRGCRAVVASPWPLDVAVPRQWLPTFLASLEAGDTVNRATFKANQAVHAREAHPSRWLALHVYGDPTARIDLAPSGTAGASDPKS